MSETDVRADDSYIIGHSPDSPFYPELALAFARLVTHGNGRRFTLTRQARKELGEVKITRLHDGQTDAVTFVVEVRDV